jgi:hypothetical protein
VGRGQKVLDKQSTLKRQAPDLLRKDGRNLSAVPEEALNWVIRPFEFDPLEMLPGTEKEV